jgi:hypothetical protein
MSHARYHRACIFFLPFFEGLIGSPSFYVSILSFPLLFRCFFLSLRLVLFLFRGFIYLYLLSFHHPSPPFHYIATYFDFLWTSNMRVEIPGWVFSPSMLPLQFPFIDNSLFFDETPACIQADT